MNNDEDIMRLWSENNREGDRENARRKRPAESRRERKMTRVKRQCVSKKSHHNLSEKKQRDIIRSKLETLKQITPNCLKSDISSILDSVIEYMNSLQFADFLTVLQNSV
ncbi:unnamed protein product [Microthlaspi erraticum]|uniref:BHLH domain-containing protein n=1 Tax=Microthlaspi erraticum TaxID=1685480 RepID=A0A6D2J8T4_9BRAS|nr:unnamed protein product [Microthlaspi erraticum]